MRPAAAWKALKKFAAAKPGAWEDHPWGETVYKIGKKVFGFMGVDSGDGSFGMSVKLPNTSEAATTMFSWCEPTGYGLGKSGWVSAHFEKKDDVPVDLLKEWLEESYQAIAPKRAARPAARRAPRRPKRAPRRAG